MESCLKLHFHEASDSALTLMRIEQMTPPWKVVRAFPLPAGEALVHLNNVSGGILGGDTLSLDVKVGREARAQVTSTGATRVYRCRPGAEPARSITNIHIAEQGLLEYLPDPVIPFASARYIQRARITLDDGAGLFWWEVLAPGRTRAGETFSYDLLESRFEIDVCGRPIAIENLRLEPATRPLRSPAHLAGFTHLTNFYICRHGLPPGKWLHYEETLNGLASEMSRPGETLWAASALVSDGIVVRGLSNSGRHIAGALFGFWRASKRLLYGQDPVAPRKIY